MTTHKVTISYISRTNVKVVPNPVIVDADDTIEFVQDPDRMTGKMQITFDEKEFFDTIAGTGVFQQGDGLVRVKTRMRERTTYKCELLDEITGELLASRDGKGGGAVDPVPNIVKNAK